MMLAYAGRIDPKTGSPETIWVEHRTVAETIMDITMDILPSSEDLLLAGAVAYIILK